MFITFEDQKRVVTTLIKSSARALQVLLWMALEVAERSGLVTVYDGSNSLD